MPKVLSVVIKEKSPDAIAGSELLVQSAYRQKAPIIIILACPHDYNNGIMLVLGKVLKTVKIISSP